MAAIERHFERRVVADFYRPASADFYRFLIGSKSGRNENVYCRCARSPCAASVTPKGLNGQHKQTRSKGQTSLTVIQHHTTGEPIPGNFMEFSQPPKIFSAQATPVSAKVVDLASAD